MACEECRELHTHRLKSRTDLVNALQVAAGEVDRGVLASVVAKDRSIPEATAVQSALWAGALPEVVRYCFKCLVCGDAFELSADTENGSGEWRRNAEQCSK